MSETTLLSAVMSALAVEPGVLAMRNNSGAFFARGRMIRYGLGVGSADIICAVGPYGRLVALECKTDDGKQSDEQIAWQRVVEALGGVYALVRSVDEARATITAVRRGRAA